MNAEHPEWQGLLDPGETILWQGAPDTKLRVQFDTPFSAVISLGVLGFAIFWMVGAARAGGSFWMFGLIITVASLYQLIGTHFYDAWKRKNTFYTLTNKRAFIASRGYKGKTLDSYLIAPDARIRLEGDTPASVFFAQETKQSGDSTKTIDIGFRYIQDATEILGHFRTIQDEARS